MKLVNGIVVVHKVKNRIDLVHLKNLIDYHLKQKEWKLKKRGMLKRRDFEELKKLIEYVENTKYLKKIL